MCPVTGKGLSQHHHDSLCSNYPNMLTQQLPKTRDGRMFALSDAGCEDAGSASVSPLGAWTCRLQALCKPRSHSIGGSADTGPGGTEAQACVCL